MMRQFAFEGREPLRRGNAIIIDENEETTFCRRGAIVACRAWTTVRPLNQLQCEATSIKCKNRLEGGTATVIDHHHFESINVDIQMRYSVKAGSEPGHPSMSRDYNAEVRSSQSSGLKTRIFSGSHLLLSNPDHNGSADTISFVARMKGKRCDSIRAGVSLTGNVRSAQCR